MGGVSQGSLTPDPSRGGPVSGCAGPSIWTTVAASCRRRWIPGRAARSDASGYDGVLLDVYGNDEEYNVHLRTADVWLPWQAYRASFTAAAAWRTVRIPFSAFSGYRILAGLDATALRRIGILAIGRVFQADLCVARVGLYRDDAGSP